MRKTMIAAGIAATFVLGAAQPAAAQGVIERTHTVTTTSTSDQGDKLTQTGTARIFNRSSATLDLQLDCQATATPLSAGLGIQECYVIGTNGARYDAEGLEGHPGGATAAAGLFRLIPRQRYQVCVRSVALFHQSGALVQAPLACSS